MSPIPKRHYLQGMYMLVCMHAFQHIQKTKPDMLALYSTDLDASSDIRKMNAEPRLRLR